MRNEKGFGLISFLSLLPLLLAIGAFTASAFILLRADAAAKHQCRTGLLRSQTRIAGRLEKLLQLNPLAKTLRAEREAADAAVRAAAAYPAALPAALAAQAAVISQQTALALKQQSLIQPSRLESQLAPGRVYLAIQNSLRSHSLRGSPPVLSSSARSGAFALSSSPATSITPDYEPMEGFERLQKMFLRVEIAISPLFPEWIQKLVDMNGLTMKTECVATIEKGNRKWTAALKPDKW